LELKIPDFVLPGNLKEGTTVAIKPHSNAKSQQIAKKIPLRKEEELRGG